MRLKRLFLGVMLLVGITGAGATNAAPEDISASISLKVPGNDAKQYPLALQKMQDGMYSCRASETLPLDIIRQVVDKDGKLRITVTLKALENVYFNYGEQIKDRLQAFGLPVLHAGLLVSPQPAFAEGSSFFPHIGQLAGA